MYQKAELIAYEDLGAEALRKLYVEDMPLVVIIDSEGNNLYEEEEKSIWKRIKKTNNCDGNPAESLFKYAPGI